MLPGMNSVVRLLRIATVVQHSSGLTVLRFPSAVLKWGRRSKSAAILGRSTVLLQDGLDIRELPWVVRHMDLIDFPFTGASYAANDVRKPGGSIMWGAGDEQFQQVLLECSTVQQVFRRLEVPGEQVTVHSAAFALRRIGQLKETTMDDVDSFIRKAILRELCETVVRDISTLSNDTLIDIVRYSLRSTSYEERFTDTLNDEIERRVGDAGFSIQQLCTLLTILSEHVRGNVNVTNNVWTHLASRYQEIDENTIADVYAAMRYVTPSLRYVWSVLDRQLQSCWWKLTPKDVSGIAVRVSIANHHNNVTLSALAKWLFANVHSITDSQLKDVLAMYAHFDYSDHNVINSLERYICAKVSMMDRTLIAMAVDYCRQRRFLSTSILDAVARDFASHYPNPSMYSSQITVNPTDTGPVNELETAHFYSPIVSYPTQLSPIPLPLTGSVSTSYAQSSDVTDDASTPGPILSPSLTYPSNRPSPPCLYAPHELLLTLRAYGALNYLPPNSSEFFAAVETALAENFNNLGPGAILELLTSFVYLERFPINFISRVFTPHFLAKLKGIREPGPRQRASKCLMLLQSAVIHEFPGYRWIQRVDRDALNISLTWLEGRNYRFHKDVCSILREMLDLDQFNEAFIPRNTPHFIDFEIFTDDQGKVLSSVGLDSKKAIKLALLCVMPEHYCVNSQHLLGEPHTKQRHLRKLGYTVVQMDYEPFTWKCRSLSSKTKYVKSVLSKYLEFPERPATEPIMPESSS